MRRYYEPGPADVAAGDPLFILQEAKTPFIVREGQYGHYRVIGDCDVEGSMDDCADLLWLTGTRKEMSIS